MPSNFVAIKNLDTIMDGAVNERFAEACSKTCLTQTPTQLPSAL